MSINQRPMTKMRRLILFTILVYALIIRLIGIPWGMQMFDPYINSSTTYHPDEPKIILGAEMFPKDIFLRTYLVYPTAYHYLIGLLGIPLKLAVKLGIENSSNLYQHFLLLGRLVSTLLGVASIYLTYILSKKLANENAGLIATGLLAVSLYYVRESSVATTDIPVSFWAIVVMLLTTKITLGSRWKAYILLGIISGIMIGTKYSGAFALIPLAIWLIYLLYNAPTDSVRYKMILLTSVCMIVTIVTFLLTTPSIILKGKDFLSSLNYEAQYVARARSPWWSFMIPSYFFTSLSTATNVFIFIAFIFALILLAIKCPNIHFAAYVILTLSYYAYFNTGGQIRYWILLLPSICVLTGWGIEKAISSTNKFIMLFGTSLLILSIATGIYQNYLLNRLLLNETRTVASRYLYQLPGASTILVGLNSQGANRWSYPFVNHPNVNYTANNILKNPDYIVVSSLAYGDYFSDYLRDGGGISQITFQDKNIEYEERATLAPNGILNIKLNNTSLHYKEIAIFKPIEPLDVEFLSPTIVIFNITK